MEVAAELSGRLGGLEVTQRLWRIGETLCVWRDPASLTLLRRGKTHLATALAVSACQAGRRVRFTTLAALANELQEAQSRRELVRVVGRYARTELVVLDELGCAPRGAVEPGGMRAPPLAAVTAG